MSSLSPPSPQEEEGGGGEGAETHDAATEKGTTLAREKVQGRLKRERRAGLGSAFVLMMLQKDYRSLLRKKTRSG